MAQVVNPKAKIKVIGSVEYEIEDLYISFDVNKDLEEEPNEATINISNLAEGTRGQILDSANESAPVEIHATAAGSSDYSILFKGEMDTARNVYTRPGWETEINCTSQQVNHRSKYIDTKEFASGTPTNQVINYFIEQIGLPLGQIDELPSTGIILSQSFSGPAFKLLKSFVYDIGLYCYILDGTINITDWYEPLQPVVIQVPTNRLLTDPIPTRRNDRSLIQLKTVSESVNRIKYEPFRKRRKKKNRQTKEVSRSDYVEFSATDTLVEGMDFEFLLQPGIQPDSIINVPLDGIKKQLWRVQEVDHNGDTSSFDEWTTSVSADKYEDPNGDVEAQLQTVAASDAVTILNVSKKTRFR